MTLMKIIGSSCGHIKAWWDNHIKCLRCSSCSRLSTYSTCSNWSQKSWRLADKRRTYSSRKWLMKKKNKKKKQPIVASDLSMDNSVDRTATWQGNMARGRVHPDGIFSGTSSIQKSLSPSVASHLRPVSPSPVIQSLVNQSLVKKSPVNQSLVNQSPVIQSPVMKSPVKTSPVNHPPVILSPVKNPPVKNSLVSLSPVNITGQPVSGHLVIGYWRWISRYRVLSPGNSHQSPSHNILDIGQIISLQLAVFLQ